MLSYTDSLTHLIFTESGLHNFLSCLTLSHVVLFIVALPVGQDVEVEVSDIDDPDPV